MQRAVVNSLVLAASISLGSTVALAADLPSPVALVGDPHEVTVNQVASGLRALGYTDVAPIDQDGRIFSTTAVWQGETHNLRINAEFGTVTDADAVTAVDGDLPGPVLFVSAPHETNVNEARSGLEALGYGVRQISQDGTVFTARADLAGETFDLRIEAATGQVTMIGTPPADVRDLPSIRLASDAHETNRNEVATALAAAGYDKVRNVTNDGRIFNANAAWRGQDMTLRIDARSGIVTQQ